jgi:hypothetical protein
MSSNGDNVDEDSFLVPSNGAPGRWSSSSSTLAEAASPLLSRNLSRSSIGLNDADSSQVPLGPLYAAGNQPDGVQSSRKVLDTKLALRSRKGHRKSRQGCFNCKKRKIKVGT